VIHEDLTKGFYPYRTDDRGRDHRYSGGGRAAAYQDYTARAKMSEAILAASACRTSVTETVQSAAVLPLGGQWGCESRAAGTHPITKYVQDIETNQFGDIRVMISGTVAAPTINPDLAGKYVILQPSSSPTAYVAPLVGASIASWTCGPQAAQTPDISKYLPAPAALPWLCKVPTPKARASRISPRESDQRFQKACKEGASAPSLFLRNRATVKMRLFQMQQVLASSDGARRVLR